MAPVPGSPNALPPASAPLALAGGMAFLAGATDIVGLSKLSGLFVSFMSGNTTLLGQALGKGDLGRAGTIAGVVGCFVAGVAGGEVMAEWTGCRHTAAVTGAVAALLALAALRPAWEISSLVLAMGVLNASMSRAGQTKVGLTYVTGTVVQRKVTNGYRAVWAARGKADVRTVVDTARLTPGTGVFATILGTVTA